MPKICKECGYEYNIHSTDGARCPKNGGMPFTKDGNLEFFATHFEPEISETDQLRATIATLTAHNESMQADAVNNTATIKMLMAQLAELKAPIEDIKIYYNNPSAWDYYDETVSQKISEIIKAAGMA